MTVFLVFVNDELTKVFDSKQSAEEFVEDVSKTEPFSFAFVSEWEVEK